jgi:16S rRNA (guanine1207-N2)-methyltransferase
MSRWAEDPERAADALMARTLDELALEGRVLLVNQGGTIPSLLRSRGLEVALWNRRLVGVFPAMSWPPPGPFDAALVRLPKARDEQEMAAHAVLGVLAPGGRLILYGGNDEGIRAASSMLEGLGGPVEVVAARGHGRVLSMRCSDAPLELRSILREWRIETPMEIAGRSRVWVSYPGMFAAGRLDDGTALLLGTLPSLPPGASVLDYGCGSGVIGATLQATGPAIKLDMLDSDSVAVEAARENVPDAHVVIGAALDDAPGGPYDAILSNPPLHQGIAEDRALLDRLVAQAPAHLAPGGVLQIVVQRRLPLDRLFAQYLGGADVIAEDAGYRVWRARRN